VPVVTCLLFTVEVDDICGFILHRSLTLFSLFGHIKRNPFRAVFLFCRIPVVPAGHRFHGVPSDPLCFSKSCQPQRRSAKDG